MATLTIRKLDDAVYERLRVQARHNNRSLEAEAREVLQDRLADLDGLVNDLEAFHERTAAKHGILPDSTPLFSEMRSE